MALFQKKPQTSDSIPLYSLGVNKTILIIGLGNPGKEYDGTRHNIGFGVMDFFAKANDFPGWIAKKDLKSNISQNTLGDTRVLLVKPTTFMNSSGEAASAVQHFYKVFNPQTLVVYDELALAFGQLRTRQGGSDAGHNGVKSLIQHIGDDFNRLRVGIGSEISEKADAADFVLGKFTKKEQESLPLVLRETNELINSYIVSGRPIPHETRKVL